MSTMASPEGMLIQRVTKGTLHRLLVFKGEHQSCQGHTEHFWVNYSKGKWKRILARDNHTCQVCGRDLALLPEYSEVDHIVPVAERWDLRFEESNLQTLCKQCHWEKTMNEKGITADRLDWARLVRGMIR